MTYNGFVSPPRFFNDTPAYRHQNIGQIEHFYQSFALAWAHARD